MLRKKEKIALYENKGNYAFIFWIFFAIIAFIAVYLPFFGGNLRYSLGKGFEAIYSTLGTYANTFGGILVGLGLFGIIISHGRGGIKMAVLGMMLLYIGGWLLGPGIIGTEYVSNEAFMGYN